jgi:hypothetical protein
MKKNIVLFLCSIFLISCSSEVSNEVPTLKDVVAQNSLNASGKPGTLVKVEGSGLSNLKQILLNDNLIVPFNQALNSEKAFFFNIPNFDPKKPYKFGVQPVKFIFENGVLESQININQPLPFISTIDPGIAKRGEKITLVGSWFYDVTSVTFDGTNVPFQSVDINNISFIIPSNYPKNVADIVVTTAAGVSNIFGLNFGLVTYVFDDFDGGGLHKGDWERYGDKGTIVTNATGQNGKCAEYDYSGENTVKFNGCQNVSKKALLPSSAKTASKVTFTMMINTTNGTKFDVYLDDWAYTFVANKTGWYEVSAKLDQFGSNYNSGNAATDTKKVDPSQILQVKVSFPGGTAKSIKFDDIKFKIEE